MAAMEAQDVPVPTSPAQAARLRELLREFREWGFDERGWSKATRRLYVSRVAACARFLRGRGVWIVRASADDLRAWLFTTPAHAATRATYRKAVVGFFDFLVESGRVRENPARTLPKLRVPKGLPKALTPAQAFALEDAAEGFDTMTRAFVLLLLYAALRRNEARLLRWTDLDLDGGWVRFSGKGEKDRAVPLHPRLLLALRAWRRECPVAEYVFPSPQSRRQLAGYPVSETCICARLRRVGAEVGLPRLHPHALRHTCATRLVELGVDLPVVRDMLGHADLATTTIYLHVRSPRMKQEVGRLNYDEDTDEHEESNDEGGQP